MMARNNTRKAEMITTDYYRDGDESRREVDRATFDRLPKTANVIGAVETGE